MFYRKRVVYLSKNGNLNVAKTVKNDEFYTQFSDVVAEFTYYKEHFKDRVIFCNCDDPVWSSFWKYFHVYFSELSLKRLVCTHYDRNGLSYKMEYEGGNDVDIIVGRVTTLGGNGDFRSQECLDLLDECDIVVTNPPFSLAREYIGTLVNHGKKFLIIGDLNWVSYKEVFPLLKEDRMWFGYSAVKEFRQPDGSIKKFGNKLWYTNLDIQKCHDRLVLSKHYVPEDYPKYDNYDAIEVSKVVDIPYDYDGVMGVPLIFLNQYNPDQFEILGMTSGRFEFGIGPSKIYKNP